MISHSFGVILLLSILLNYMHGIECVKTKFWDIEPNIYFFTRKFTSIPESVYFVFHGSFWVFILLAFFLLLGGRWIFIPLVIYGTVFFTESHHFIKGLKQREYYPGMITSFFFPITGLFYWIELIKMWN